MNPSVADTKQYRLKHEATDGVNGKGGTSKTFIALNITYLLRNRGAKVLLVDADVENL